MNCKRKIGFGLLGAGLIAPFHGKSIKASEDCELVAVADFNAQRASQFARTYGCKACGSLDELLADKAIDVICILTPNHMHYEAALACAKAGKHMLVEKPPSLSLKHTDEMIKAAGDAGVKLGIVLQCRMRKAIMAIAQAAKQGRFGRLLCADAYMKWYRSEEYYLSDPWRSARKSGAGVTIQHAFHYIDLLVHLMGPARSVAAKMTNMMHPAVELEDTLHACIEYRCGARGVVAASTALWPGLDIRIEISGENGTAVMVGERIDVWKFKDDRPEDDAIRAIGRSAVATAASGPADFDFADHKVLIEDMARAVSTGAEPAITAASARNTLETALAMYKSAKLGKDVTLPLADEEDIW